MTQPPWLKRYFSPTDFLNLTPVIVYDGKKYAVVRIHQSGRVAFLGVWKGGRNNLTTAEPLREGGADAAQLKKMKDWLEKKDRA